MTDLDQEWQWQLLNLWFMYLSETDGSPNDMEKEHHKYTWFKMHTPTQRWWMGEYCKNPNLRDWMWSQDFGDPTSKPNEADVKDMYRNQKKFLAMVAKVLYEDPVPVKPNTASSTVGSSASSVAGVPYSMSESTIATTTNRLQRSNKLQPKNKRNRQHTKQGHPNDTRYRQHTKQVHPHDTRHRQRNQHTSARQLHATGYDSVGSDPAKDGVNQIDEDVKPGPFLDSGEEGEDSDAGSDSGKEATSIGTDNTSDVTAKSNS